MIKSPLINSNNTQIVSQLSSKKIVDRYKNEFQIDVSSYFEGVSTVTIARCETSRLKFYYPFTLAGNADFYAQLSKNYAGYYSVWKWEHQKTFDFIKNQDKVLEIGCGNGYFLREIQKEKQVNVTGLDFNPSSVQYGLENSINIIPEDIADHAKNNNEQYDAVVAFQLFEHVNDVGIFLENTLKCLRKGGICAIGVPNNDSFVFTADPYHTLNVPPHHTLLWDARSLSFLATHYDLELIEITSQPVTADFKSAAYRLWLNNNLGNNFFSKTMHQLTRWFVKKLPIFEEGQTILAIYQKK